MHSDCMYPGGVTATLSEDVLERVDERAAEVSHGPGRLLSEVGDCRSQVGVAPVPRETERRLRPLRELDDGEARQGLQNVEPVDERAEEAPDRRKLERREGSVDQDGDVQHRLVAVVDHACRIHDIVGITVSINASLTTVH